MESLLLGAGLLLGAYVLVYYNLVKAPPCGGIGSLRGRTAVVTGKCTGVGGRPGGGPRPVRLTWPLLAALRRQQRHREDDGPGTGAPGSSRGAGLPQPGTRRGCRLRPPPGEGKRGQVGR
jgi:hypothetical protein